jgi:hypothetical protein
MVPFQMLHLLQPPEEPESLLPVREFALPDDSDGGLLRAISVPGIVLATLPLKYRNDETTFSKSSFSNRLPVSATKMITLAYPRSFALPFRAT